MLTTIGVPVDDLSFSSVVCDIPLVAISDMLFYEGSGVNHKSGGQHQWPHFLSYLLFYFS